MTHPLRPRRPGRAARPGLAAAVTAVRRGQLVVLPTDTVYGVGVDAFDAEAVQRLLDAKGRGRDMPPPVLISADTTLEALATELPGLGDAAWSTQYWPGPLTIVCRQQPSLRWDLGETRGTVAVRMPDDERALELLGRTGPLAVSSANTTGQPAATNADDGRARCSAGGRGRSSTAARAPGAAASTIVDCTGDRPRILREGAISAAEIDRVLEDSGPSSSVDPRAELERRRPRPSRRRPRPSDRDRAGPCVSTSLVFLVAGVVSYLLCVVRPRAGDPLGRGRPGARPRRARDPDPVLRRGRDARRPRRRATWWPTTCRS